MGSRSVTFYVSADLNVQFKVKIASLEGSVQLLKESTKITDPKTLKKLSNYHQYSDLFISVVVMHENEQLTIPITTSYISFRNSRKWNEWLSLPINVNQLPLNSKLKIILWEYDKSIETIFGETELDIFNQEDCTLKRGRQKLKIRLPNDPDNSKSLSEMNELEKLIKKHENGDINSVDWLDSLTFKKIDQFNKKQQNLNKGFVLFIDFQQYDIPVVFNDFKYPKPLIPTYTSHNHISNTDTNNQPKIQTGDYSTLRIYDPDQYISDPIEHKYRKLERSHKGGPFDRDIKPTAKIRDELNKILNYSSVQELSQYEKNLVWKFRYFLINNKKGLNKLLKSINFNDESENKECLKLLKKWVEIDIEDALELLGPFFTNFTVRNYAVERLKKAHDDEIELYLLELVQALDYETKNSTVDFSIVELSEPSISNDENNENSNLTPLASFLIERGLLNARLGSFLYWYLNVAAKDKPGSIHEKILTYYLKNNQDNSLQKEIEFVNNLVQLCIKVKNLRDSTPKKIEFLRNILETKFKSFSPIKLPLDPSIEICGCVPNESSVFKSSLSPLKISFKTTNGEIHPLMFKVGDDLRQDQLVIQIILLMNQLLMNENVDLKLSPYKILATGPTEGAIQFVPNSTLDSVLADYHGILPYLKHHHPDPNEELGVKSWVMDNFVRSCAGYCVITYILAVGDRHLDNLLICTDGHFLHADFGYILGQDPKLFPPLMKLPPQIIDGFGGADSVNYNKFRNYCFVAYSILRKNSNLILNLFELMRDSSIPDIALDPDNAVMKVKEKFCLDMSEEEAIIHFQNLINDSVSALLPMVIDRLHSLAQYWRA